MGSDHDVGSVLVNSEKYGEHAYYFSEMVQVEHFYGDRISGDVKLNVISIVEETEIKVIWYDQKGVST